MRALKRDMGDRQWFVLYVVVCIEVGIFLTLVPWSAIWERNYFLDAYPPLRAILLVPAVRGAVAGLGIANIYMGLKEVVTRRRLLIGEERSGEEGPADEGGLGDDTGMGRSDREAVVGAEEPR
jgi:hypothetical protein